MQREAHSGPNTLTKRPTTPHKSKGTAAGATPDPMIPPLPKEKESKEKEKENQPPRRTSLGFLRRSKSSDPRNRQPAIPAQPPQLPALFDNGSPAPIKTFGGEHAREVETRDSIAIVSGKYGPGPLGVPPVPSYARKSMESQGNKSFQDSMQQHAGSMANRGRYSYASSAVSTVNSPRRVRRRRDPTPFNILLIGARGSGKTSFLQFLKQTLTPKNKSAYADANPQTPSNGEVNSQTTFEPTTGGTFTKTYLETEIDGERIGLTLWDSVSLEKSVVDLQLREIAAFIESKFEETFNEETKVVRAPGVRDTHIHACFHLLDPARLDEHIKKTTGATAAKLANGSGPVPVVAPESCLDDNLDLQVFRILQGKTTVIPVISKADNCTTKHMELLKHLVNSSIRRAGLNPLEALDLESTASEPASPPPPSRGRKGGRVQGIKEESDEEDNSEDDQPIEPSSSADASDSDEPAPRPNQHRRTSSRLSTGSLPPTSPLSTLIPLSIISPDSYEPGQIGRSFPWGFADPFNPNHCDFGKLREMVFSEWRAELREASREVWYENWRTARLGGRGVGF